MSREETGRTGGDALPCPGGDACRDTIGYAGGEPISDTGGQSDDRPAT